MTASPNFHSDKEEYPIYLQHSLQQVLPVLTTAFGAGRVANQHTPISINPNHKPFPQANTAGTTVGGPTAMNVPQQPHAFSNGPLGLMSGAHSEDVVAELPMQNLSISGDWGGGGHDIGTNMQQQPNLQRNEGSPFGAAAQQFYIGRQDMSLEAHAQGAEQQADLWGNGSGAQLSVQERVVESDEDLFAMFVFKVVHCSKQFVHDWKECPYAHEGETARRRHPSQHTAQPCPEFKSSKMCPRGEKCQMAHGPWEAGLHPDAFRTNLCAYGRGCQRRMCFFAHDVTELRTPQPGLVQQMPISQAQLQLKIPQQMSFGFGGPAAQAMQAKKNPVGRGGGLMGRQMQGAGMDQMGTGRGRSPLSQPGQASAGLLRPPMQQPMQQQQMQMQQQQQPQSLQLRAQGAVHGTMHMNPMQHQHQHQAATNGTWQRGSYMQQQQQQQQHSNQHQQQQGGQDISSFVQQQGMGQSVSSRNQMQGYAMYNAARQAQSPNPNINMSQAGPSPVPKPPAQVGQQPGPSPQVDAGGAVPAEGMRATVANPSGAPPDKQGVVRPGRPGHPPEWVKQEDTSWVDKLLDSPL